MLDIINVAQLEVLGFKKEYRIITVVFMSFFMISFILKPFVMIVSHNNYIFVLTYTIGSLLLLVITFIIAYLFNDTSILKPVFQSVVFFGIGFVFYLLFKVIKEQIKNV